MFELEKSFRYRKANEEKYSRKEIFTLKGCANLLMRSASRKKKKNIVGRKRLQKNSEKSNNALFERSSQLIEDQIRNRAKLAWKASTKKREFAVKPKKADYTHLLWPSLPFGPIKVSFILEFFLFWKKRMDLLDSFPHKNLLSEILFYKGRSSFNERGCYRLNLRRKCPRRDFLLWMCKPFDGILNVGFHTIIPALFRKLNSEKKKAEIVCPKSTAKEFRKVEQCTLRTKLPANRRSDKEQGEIGVEDIDRQKRPKKADCTLTLAISPFLDLSKCRLS
ncbi:hypothetical protein CEXT_688901 [Caerostris extrusa]|uniref:Uncharacterized protein n=1 Tax=Caerostris extrusa TaxID=172846 RepID=A0AAV4P819_CAEEX|nr:hypothetical protein CEXT_688901 [Caerostris extrusa]